MRSVAFSGILIIWASLAILVDSSPSYAQPKPDTYVSVGPVVRETHVVKGTVHKLVVNIGNQGAAPPPNTIYFAAMDVLSAEAKLICRSSGPYPNLPPGTSFAAFQFRVSYPGVATQLPPKDTPQSPVTSAGPIVRPVKYTVKTHIAPTSAACPQIEADCVNNWVTRTLELPAGGTPSCTKLH